MTISECESEFSTNLMSVSMSGTGWVSVARGVSAPPLQLGASSSAGHTGRRNPLKNHRSGEGRDCAYRKVLATATINGAQMRQGCSAGGGLVAGLGGVAVSPVNPVSPTTHAHTRRSPRGLHKCKDIVATACSSTCNKICWFFNIQYYYIIVNS